MRHFWFLLGIAAMLLGCAAPPAPPKPDDPECRAEDKVPVDGGLGGTGNREDDPCAKDQD